MNFLIEISNFEAKMEVRIQLWRQKCDFKKEGMPRVAIKRGSGIKIKEIFVKDILAPKIVPNKNTTKKSINERINCSTYTPIK